MVPHSKHYIYTDESYIKDGRYMLIGGLWIAKENIIETKTFVDVFKTENSMTNELKWTKVSNGRIIEYKRFVDIFFQSKMKFNCIVVDKHIVDHTTFNDGDKELGFYKFYYQLISRNCAFNCHYNLYLDQMNNKKKSRYSELKERLNRYLVSQNSKCIHIEPVDSKKESMIQLVDVLLGAVGYSWNLNNSSPAKLRLIEYIQSKLGRRLTHPTSLHENKFNIWNFRLRKTRPGS